MPIVKSVEEIDGVMGPDIAIVTLNNGIVVELGVEGIAAWPSAGDFKRQDSDKLIGSVIFPRNKKRKTTNQEWTKRNEKRFARLAAKEADGTLTNSEAFEFAVLLTARHFHHLNFR